MKHELILQEWGGGYQETQEHHFFTIIFAPLFFETNLI
jgi:hypothetical protein